LGDKRHDGGRVFDHCISPPGDFSTPKSTSLIDSKEEYSLTGDTTSWFCV
jgi:hypothetical protein